MKHYITLIFLFFILISPSYFYEKEKTQRPQKLKIIEFKVPETYIPKKENEISEVKQVLVVKNKKIKNKKVSEKKKISRKDTNTNTNTKPKKPHKSNNKNNERKIYPKDIESKNVNSESICYEVKEKVFLEKVIDSALDLLGTKYKYGGNGGNGEKGVDCSGLTKKVYEECDVSLPRTSCEQFKEGEKIKVNCEKKGDLIFFSGSGRNVGHVGIIINPEKKLMVHASSGAKKVTISNYKKPYYKKHFKGIRRVKKEGAQ